MSFNSLLVAVLFYRLLYKLNRNKGGSLTIDCREYQVTHHLINI